MKKKSTASDRALTVAVKVEPRSSKSGIVGTHGNALKIKLTSPPVDGKANKELVDILAREFSIRKKDVEIISGHSSKHKTVRLNCVSDLDSILRKY